MADPLFFLSKDDRDALQQMLTVFKQRRLNPQSRSPLDLPGRSSDTYIAIPTTVDGIPPLSRSGTSSLSGTFPEANTDIPGSAECDIYQIVDVGDGSPTIEPLEFNVIVYNLSQSTIGQDWITVTRDRFGAWIATSVASITSTITTKRGKLVTTLFTGSRNGPSQAQLKLWTFDGAQWDESDTTIDIYDDGMLSLSAEPLAIDTWVQVVLISGVWFYDGHNCDPLSGTGTGS